MSEYVGTMKANHSLSFSCKGIEKKQSFKSITETVVAVGYLVDNASKILPGVAIVEP
ncbi:hypothetical protein STEG23_031794, partial [Scotinomys teguina]